MMPVIDSHTHMFPDRIAAKAVASLSETSHTLAFTDGTEAGLLASSKRAGIHLSIVLPVATRPQQVKKINDKMALLKKEHAGRGLSALACMHPGLEDPEEELERIAAMGFAGFKIHPVFHHTDVDDPSYLRMFRKAKDLKLIIVTHAGRDIGFPEEDRCSPLKLRRAVDLSGYNGFVMAHMGGWGEWETVGEMLADTGVYLDTAFTLGVVPAKDEKYRGCRMCSQEQFLAIVHSFGAERILFGSDSPWYDQQKSLQQLLELPLDEDTQKLILYKNACRLFGIGS